MDSGTGRWRRPMRFGGGALALTLGLGLLVALVVASMPALGRDPLGQAATPAATPANDRAELTDLQTRVAVLATEVARLGGADPEAIAGRLGGDRAGFDDRYGRPAAYPAPGEVIYDVPDVGRLRVAFAEDAATRLVVTPGRPPDKPLEEPDEADWPIDTARELVARFAPADAAFGAQEAIEGGPGLRIPGDSEALAAAVVPADPSGCPPSGAAAFSAVLSTPTPETVSAITLAFEGGTEALAPTTPERDRTNRGGGAVANSSLGGVVNVNGVSVQAIQVRPDATGARQPAPDQALWGVELIVENGSDRPLSYDLVDFALVDGRDRQIPAICGGVEPAITRGELAPGETIEGWVTFQVPEAFEPERFVFQASGSRIGFLLR